MTLLEIIMSLAILLALSVGIGDMLRRSLDLKVALSEKESVNHRLVRAMNIIARDIQHAFIIPETDLTRMTSNRTTKTIFRIESTIAGGDNLFMTTMNHRPILANSGQGDSTYMVYTLEDSKNNPGRKDLMRGVAPRIPESFREDPPKQVLVSSVKEFRVRPWRGDDWSRDRWDSSRSEWRDRMPHMVLVELEIYNLVAMNRHAVNSAENELSTKLSTVVYLPYASSHQELREGSRTIRWDKL
jgi:hypothetical protein